MSKTFLAHSVNARGQVEPLDVHCKATAELAASFGKRLRLEQEACLAGLLHDIGKLGSVFLMRLQGKARHVDHWSFGAWVVYEQWQESGKAAAFAINGHHKGLGHWSGDFHGNLAPDKIEAKLSELGRGKLSRVKDRQTALDWLVEHDLVLPEAFESVRPKCPRKASDKASAMLDVRMLYSTLVDADFIATESHFQATEAGRYTRPKPLELNPKAALALVLKYIENRKQDVKCSVEIKQLRTDLLQACLESGKQTDQRLFTLTAPTGSGKTLAMLAFALQHAIQNNLDRIVLVVPFLSIIEQTAKIYRELFESEFGPLYVLEDHSQARLAPEDKDQDVFDENIEESRRIQGMHAENWDSPIVITTSVQFFESLFSSRPRACRKLHRLGKSVVLFDEIQTFPIDLAVPTLATLSRLSERYDSTLVMATATQPAFGHLNEEVKKLCHSGWEPREIVPSELKLFERTKKRVKVTWPRLEKKTKFTSKIEETAWDAIAEELASHDRALCVVNLKRHALDLVAMLKERRGGSEGLFHLSTNMCPAHRKRTLAEVRSRLDVSDNRSCLLVATQCIEAGVDVDFPVLYRAMGPLDSIAQAAGRCNRNGRLETGEVRVFLPEEDGCPPGGYRQAIKMTESMLRKQRDLDIDDPAIYTKYYRQLYDLRDLGESELIEQIKSLDFPETDKLYRLISNDTINVLTPYDRTVYDELVAQAEEEGLTQQWRQKAQSYSVSLYRPQMDNYGGYLNPVPIRESFHEKDVVSDEWFILLDDDSTLYDRDLLGLCGLPSESWIA